MFFKLYSPFTLSLLLFSHSSSPSRLKRVRADPQTPASVRATHRRPCRRGRASAPTRGRRRTRVRAYITPIRIPHFCSFSPLPLVGVVGFAWQRPIRLAKGEGVISILRGIPLRFLHCKNSRIVFTLLMLVYSIMQVFM
jgi:hypothetical protein